MDTLENPEIQTPTLAEINVCKLRGQASVAIALAQQRLEAIPDCATTHALLGELYETAGHVSDARHHYALAVDCAPGNNDHIERLRRVMRTREHPSNENTGKRNNTSPDKNSKTLEPKRRGRRIVKPIDVFTTWYKSLHISVKLSLLTAGAIGFTLAGIAAGTSLINRGPDPNRAKQQPTYPKFDPSKQSSSSGDSALDATTTLAEGAKPPILGASAETSTSQPTDDDPIDLPGTQNLTWDPERKRLTFDVQTEIPKTGVQQQRLQLRQQALQWLGNAFAAEPDATEAVVNLVAGSPKMTLVTLGATRAQIDTARNADPPADSAVSIEEWALPFKS